MTSKIVQEDWSDIYSVCTFSLYMLPLLTQLQCIKKALTAKKVIKDVKKQKFNFTRDDFQNTTSSLWTRDSPVFIHGLLKIFILFALQVYLFIGAVTDCLPGRGLIRNLFQSHWFSGLVRDLMCGLYGRMASGRLPELPRGTDSEVVGRLICSWLAESSGSIDSKWPGGGSSRGFFLIWSSMSSSSLPPFRRW